MMMRIIVWLNHDSVHHERGSFRAGCSLLLFLPDDNWRWNRLLLPAVGNLVGGRLIRRVPFCTRTWLGYIIHSWGAVADCLEEDGGIQTTSLIPSSTQRTEPSQSLVEKVAAAA
jgi:hypothetical protein